MTLQIGPILDSVPIRTANYQNCGILRFDAESPFESTRGHQIPRKGSRRIYRCPRPKLGTKLAPSQGPKPITPNHDFNSRLDTGRAVTTAIWFDRTNVHPALRHPVVANLRCIPIRLPLLSTYNHRTSPVSRTYAHPAIPNGIACWAVWWMLRRPCVPQSILRVSASADGRPGRPNT